MADSTNFQTCQSLEYSETGLGFSKPNYNINNNGNISDNKNSTNFMTIKTEYTHDFQNVKNQPPEITTNYEDDFEEYYSDEEEGQDNDKTRLTNKASLREIDDVVDIYKNQLNENQTAKKGGFYNNNNLEGNIANILLVSNILY